MNTWVRPSYLSSLVIIIGFRDSSLHAFLFYITYFWRVFTQCWPFISSAYQCKQWFIKKSILWWKWRKNIFNDLFTHFQNDTFPKKFEEASTSIEERPSSHFITLTLILAMHWTESKVRNSLHYIYIYIYIHLWQQVNTCLYFWWWPISTEPKCDPISKFNWWNFSTWWTFGK